MTVIQKTIADLVEMWERQVKMQPYPEFAIDWAFKKPGEDKALLGILRRADGGPGGAEGNFVWEVWEL